MGASINFDELSKEEVLKVLKLMEPFNNNMQVLTKNNMSKSLGNLDSVSKGPGEVSPINPMIKSLLKGTW